MNIKEVNDISVSLSVLISEITSDDTDAEHIANTATDFVKEIIKKHPKIKETLDDIFSELGFDENVAWIRFNRQ